MATDIKRTIEAVWRIESVRLITGLARVVHDIGLAEDLAQDALVTALESWPQSGVPENPGAWLMLTAKRRGLDILRRQKMLDHKHKQLRLGHESRQEYSSSGVDSILDGEIGDDVLRLLFIACHPALTTESRVAFTLRMVGGLTTAEIARAFLVSEPTIAQRIVRAKRTISEANVPFEVPAGAERAERISSVLEVIYFIFNEGYSATMGRDWTRPNLCEDALRLGRMVAELAPAETEAHGLVALMELQAARLPARVGSSGEPVLLLQQNRATWDRLLIRRGFAALDRAGKMTGQPGPYMVQAAIAACHARANTPEDTDWAGIVALYETLGQLMPSPVVELNRAVAVSMASGVAAGLVIVERLMAEPSLQSYHLLPTVRADFLAKLGRIEEACAEFERAAELTQNERERALLLAKVHRYKSA
jgi:RNA polymerase sigma factor (sigma-70 family)